MSTNNLFRSSGRGFSKTATGKIVLIKSLEGNLRSKVIESSWCVLMENISFARTTTSIKLVASQGTVATTTVTFDSVAN